MPNSSKGGISRGRISQLRKKGPVGERAFFGYGPIGVGIPLRETEGRDLPVLASEDVASRTRLSDVLTSLSFHVVPEEIRPVGKWEPNARDAVAICGPKSSISIGEILGADPATNFVKENGQWVLVSKPDDEVFVSGMDSGKPKSSDVGYLGRLATPEGGITLIVAGVHAIGSAGVIHYLENNLEQLYKDVGVNQFSMVIQSSFDKSGSIKESSALCGPNLQ